jgi:signal transduction histidine kinase/CheY-like chemotaxis protein
MLYTPEDRAAGQPAAELRSATQSGSALDERLHLRRDGGTFWASGVMSAARDEAGAVLGFVKIMRDQSERKAAETRLEEALEAQQQLRANAEKANRTKDEFISTVSHELRTPLNTIRLWSRMLAAGKVRDGDVIEGGRMIDRAALAQQQLIDDLLDASRMATGQLRIVPRDVNLVSSIEGAVDAIRSLAESRRVDLQVDAVADIGIVRADPDRMQQVVWNLVANAVKFTPEGGSVVVRLRRLDGTVQIEVVDSGIGIRPEFLPHVFERFRQAEHGSSRRYGGLGLGLAIAKQLVEMHGGSIRASSEGEGRGSVFTVQLPLQRRDPDAEGDPIAASARLEGHSLRGWDVLLVEDDAMARAAMERLLREAGAQVRAVDSARRARDAHAARRPDVIVADIGMPDETGHELIASLREVERGIGTRRTPAIAVTAFVRKEDRERALEAGFDEHLAKPVDPDRLVGAIVQLLAVRASDGGSSDLH